MPELGSTLAIPTGLTVASENVQWRIKGAREKKSISLLSSLVRKLKLSDVTWKELVRMKNKN